MSKRNYRYRIEIKFVKTFIDCPYPKFIRYIKNVTGKLFMLPHEKHIQLYKIIIFYN